MRRKKLEPFRPSSKSHNMASAEELFPPKTVEKKEVEQNLDAFADGMKDAETGEPIVLSKSGWNVKEGRLNLNTQTILAMGTGRLDIKNRVKLDEAPNTQKLPTRTLYTGGKLSPIYSGEHTPQSYRPSDPAFHSKLVHMRAGNILNDDSHNDASGFNSPVTSALSSTNISRRNSYQPDTNLNAALLARALQSIPQTPHTALTEEIPTGHRRHPLLTQYLKEGPLNAMYHRYWDPRSNTVVAEDEHGQPLEVAEEGVDDSGDEADEGDREEHTALATHLSTLNSTVGRSTSLRGGDDGSSVTSSSSMTISLASRLTGSMRHRHKRASDKGSWSHRSRKDSETASSRLAGSAASQAAVDLTIGVVDPAIGERVHIHCNPHSCPFPYVTYITTYQQQFYRTSATGRPRRSGCSRSCSRWAGSTSTTRASPRSRAAGADWPRCGRPRELWRKLARYAI